MAALMQAKRLNDESVKEPPRKVAPTKDRVLTVPDYFMKGVRKNKKALKAWEGSSYSHGREYVVWVAQAKTEETRARRLKTSVEWLAQGKGTNWKYET